ncbi:hypothetical protein [Sphingobium sp.]|uniref:hypothetical protein n=1 Tax=Sphingobium sp. TaxID=1912891 RepID=UPI002ED61FEF
MAFPDLNLARANRIILFPEGSKKPILMVACIGLAHQALFAADWIGVDCKLLTEANGG